ncbi:MAG: transposase [Solirubrobacteraceae bacterium]
MARRLDDVRLAVMMLDGLEIAGRVHVVALGISTDGVKVPLGLWEGSTENATLARSLLADLVDRGLDPGQAILFVLDGGQALRRAIKDVLGEYALVHRCHRHKERNVLDLLPERGRPKVLARIRGAWALKSAKEAETQRNVKRWQDGNTQTLDRRGMLQAEQQFRHVIGYTDLPKLIIAIKRRPLSRESQGQGPDATREVVTV